jgi:transposase
VNPKDAAAIGMVTRMDALFLVDRHARQQHWSIEQRLAQRREHADSWAMEIHDECESLRQHVLPKSALGQAVSYTLNMWPKLRRVFDYAQVELSNNLAENSMRPIALGRKNWLHVGSAQSGPKVAAILSVVESCRRLDLSVKDYLLAVLPGMARRNLSDANHLTPARWAASRH